MTDHDPLCRNTDWTPWTAGARCPVCDEIARVRANEQERHGSTCRGMWDEWMHDLREKVDALHGCAPSTYWDDALDEVLALLDEEGGQR
jgi:hypothetical protein